MGAPGHDDAGRASAVGPGKPFAEKVMSDLPAAGRACIMHAIPSQYMHEQISDDTGYPDRDEG